MVYVLVALAGVRVSWLVYYGRYFCFVFGGWWGESGVFGSFGATSEGGCAREVVDLLHFSCDRDRVSLVRAGNEIWMSWLAAILWPVLLMLD